jgi:hypothetical protein
MTLTGPHLQTHRLQALQLVSGAEWGRSWYSFRWSQTSVCALTKLSNRAMTNSGQAVKLQAAVKSHLHASPMLGVNAPTCRCLEQVKLTSTATPSKPPMTW